MADQTKKRNLWLSAAEMTELLGQAMLQKHPRYDNAVCTLRASPEGEFSATVELTTDQQKGLE